jgi:hypothetical protein
MSDRVGNGVLHRKPRPHSCAPPDLKAHAIEVGDKWECLACASMWVVKYGSDCRPGEGGPYWKRETTTMGIVGIKGEWVGSAPPKGGDWDGDCG